MPEVLLDHADISGSLVPVIASSPLPVALLELPAETLIAASPPALHLIGQTATALGRSIEDFMSDAPTGGLVLLMKGRLNGYETTRRFRGTDGDRMVRVWVRALSQAIPVRHALIVFSFGDEVTAGLHDLAPSSGARLPVIGTVDTSLTVDRVSSDVAAFLGLPASEVLHRPFLEFPDQNSAGRLLVAVAEATNTGRGTSVRIPLKRADGSSLLTDIAIVPLSPAPSFAFVFTDAAPNSPSGPDAAAGHLVATVGQLVDCVDASRTLAECCRPVPGLEKLTTREFHVVNMLLQGDRVPAIARSLFLSQSTVRNHLSSVFAKLGVSSQQALITLLRTQKADPPNG
ncbi:hypothetical protein BH10ACT10_BH10ACT10_01160 [soil metagenome]